MAFLVLFSAFVLAPATYVVGQPPGFLSIDCGLDAKDSGYTDNYTSIVFVSDGPYVDTGENRAVAAEHKGRGIRHLQTLRSFPSGVRNCYALPTVAGTKYLVRMEFSYGNYDGKSSSTVEFNLYLGSDYWATAFAYLSYESTTSEAIFVAWAGRTPVCLVNTGRGTPFVSVLELRPLPSSLYPPVVLGTSMSMYERRDVGANGKFTRYPNDPFDRFWWSYNGTGWMTNSTKSTIQPDPTFVEPSQVLQTAATSSSNEKALIFGWQSLTTTNYSFMVFLHFADFQSRQHRQFDIFFNGNRLGGPNENWYTPEYLVASCVYSSGWYKATDGQYGIFLSPTGTSVLPPMLNAFEIYTLISHESPTTFSKDCELSISVALMHTSI